MINEPNIHSVQQTNQNLKNKSQLQPIQIQSLTKLKKSKSQNKKNKQKQKIINDADFLEIMDQLESSQIKRNTFIFGICMLITQIVICIVYGFKVKVPSMDQPIFQDFVPIMLNILTALTIIVGFGLLFGYLQKAIWSALGFNLFICCFTIQIYFIINNLINRIGINSSLTKYSQEFQIYLYNFQYHVNPNNSIEFMEPFGNTLIDGFKAGLCNCIIFSCILGRAGLLESYFVTIVGTIGYQFNRQILKSYGIDFGDSNSIFTFGGFCGLFAGLILAIHYRRKPFTTSKKNKQYTANLNSTGLSVMGCAFLVALFPTLTLHLSSIQFSALPTVLGIAPYSLYISSASSVILAIGTSITINGKINIRDFINGSIAGSIAGLCGSYMFANPVFGQIVGATAGALQVIIQNFCEKKIARKYQIVTTYSFCLFGLQGLLGGIYATIFKKVLQIYSSTKPNYPNAYYQPYDLPFTTYYKTQPIVFSFISIGIGIGAGIVLGIIIFFMAAHKKQDHFQDNRYWKDLPGVSFLQKQQELFGQMNKISNFKPGIVLQ